MQFGDYNVRRGLVVDVDLAAPPEERWREAVSVIGPEVHQLARETLDWCTDALPRGWPPWLRALATTALHGTADLTGRAVSLVAELLGHEYAREIRSIAAGSGVSYPQLLLANVMYDIAEGWRHFHPAACSSFSCNLPRGVPVLARTLDWGIPENLGRYSVLVFYHRGRKHYVSVGLTGFVGILSAMRPAAWAVALNKAPARQHPFQIHHMPACIRLRHVCDSSTTFDAMVRRTKQSLTMTPFFAHVIGTEAHDHTVIRSLGGPYRERRIEDLFIVQTNHHLNPKHHDLNDLSVSYENSSVRYHALKRRLQRAMPTSVEGALAKLRGQPITNERTIQSMAFCPATGDWRLRIAG